MVLGLWKKKTSCISLFSPTDRECGLVSVCLCVSAHGLALGP